MRYGVTVLVLLPLLCWGEEQAKPIPLTWHGGGSESAAGDWITAWVELSDLPFGGELRLHHGADLVAFLATATTSCSEQATGPDSLSFGANPVTVCIHGEKPGKRSLVAVYRPPAGEPHLASTTVTFDASTFWFSPALTAAVPILIGFVGGLFTTAIGESIKTRHATRKDRQKVQLDIQRFVIGKFLPALQQHQIELASLVNIQTSDPPPNPLSKGEFQHFHETRDAIKAFSRRQDRDSKVPGLLAYDKCLNKLNREIETQRRNKDADKDYRRVRHLAQDAARKLRAIVG